VVHGFNTLEQEWNSAICAFLFDDCDRLGLLVICKMNYAAKVDLFKRLLLDQQNAIDKTMPCFESFLQSLNTAGRLRNTVVHADWETAHEDGYTLCKLKVNRKGLQHEYVQFSPESLQGIMRYYPSCPAPSDFGRSTGLLFPIFAPTHPASLVR
jgi:hypothetical protein